MFITLFIDVVLVCLMLTSAWTLLFSLQYWFCPFMLLGWLLTIHSFIHSFINTDFHKQVVLVFQCLYCWFFSWALLSCLYCFDFVQEVFIISIWVLLTMDIGVASKSLIMLMRKIFRCPNCSGVFSFCPQILFMCP